MDGRALYSLATPGQDSPTVLESRSSAPAQWQAPEPSRLDDLIYSMQDKRVDLKRVVQSIKKSAGSIADNIDPYLQEELFHGRAAKAVKDFLDLELRPLIAKMRMRGVEMAGEEQAFASEGAPRLAPNGKPSKLNAHQWKQVRTPEFKAWFGDWEHLARRNALDAMPPVSIDYSAFGDRNADPDGFESRAKDAYKQIGGAENRIDKHRIDFVMTGYRKLLSHSGDAKTLEIVAGLKSLMENAVPLYSEPNRNPKPNDQIIAWHTYGARALIDGEAAYVKLVVREKADGKRILDHFHDATVTGENEVRAPYPASSHPLSMQGTTAGMAPDKDRLRIWYNAVNPDSISKVVDENGEPRVVYHGTMADRSEFGPKRARQNFDDGNERGMHLSFNLDEPNSMAWRAGGLGLEPLDNLRRDG